MAEKPGSPWWNDAVGSYVPVFLWLSTLRGDCMPDWVFFRPAGATSILWRCGGWPCRPSALRIQIKASKTDPFRQGVSVHIGWTGEALCPVTALLRYMAARGGNPGPLFIWVDGRFLTWKTFVAGVRAALTSAGYPAANYAGHSFRIGAATTAAQRGVQDSLIQTLGRWQSSAYTRYIQTAPKTLRGVARTLVQGRESWMNNCTYIVLPRSY